ncbi:hypothetical protein KAW48_02450, partial [candidate division WOR-3 bacterium]|nr:hypothetical protein [candidate division WOR-3 bacterium]
MNNRLSNYNSHTDHDFIYTYDFQGLRVKKREIIKQGEFGLKGTINTTITNTYYLYDISGRLLCEYGDEGNLTKKFVYLPSAIIQISSNDTSYLHLDNLGSPTVVTDESGNVIKEYR